MATTRRITRWAGFLLRLVPLAAVLAGAGCESGMRYMPAPTLFAERPDAARFAEVPEARRSGVMPVFYVTDRRDDDPGPGLAYGYRRAMAASWGVATVAVDGAESWDELVALSTSPGRRPLLRLESVDELGLFPPEPGGFVEVGPLMVEDPAHIERRDRAAAQLRADMLAAMEGGNQRELLIFVHGVNTPFHDACYIAGQLWHMTGRRGLAVSYSWPAGSGGLRGYAYDRESGEYTIRHLKLFLAALAEDNAFDAVHIVAHSRGTDVVTAALRELEIADHARGRDFGARLRLRHLVLAAADIDLGIVTQRIIAERILLIPESTTVYVSSGDRALGLASWLFRDPRRLGRLRPGDLTTGQRRRLAANGSISIIDADVRSGDFGHNYFFSHPAVASDLVLLLRDDAPPVTDGRRPLTPIAERYFRLEEGYPAPPR